MRVVEAYMEGELVTIHIEKDEKKMGSCSGYTITEYVSIDGVPEVWTTMELGPAGYKSWVKALQEGTHNRLKDAKL